MFRKHLTESAEPLPKQNNKGTTEGRRRREETIYRGHVELWMCYVTRVLLVLSNHSNVKIWTEDCTWSGIVARTKEGADLRKAMEGKFWKISRISCRSSLPLKSQREGFLNGG